MNAEDYAALRGAVLAQEPGTWICRPADCRRLVERLGGLAAGERRPVLLEAAQ